MYGTWARRCVGQRLSEYTCAVGTILYAWGVPDFRKIRGSIWHIANMQPGCRHIHRWNHPTACYAIDTRDKVSRLSRFVTENARLRLDLLRRQLISMYCITFDALLPASTWWDLVGCLPCP